MPIIGIVRTEWIGGDAVNVVYRRAAECRRRLVRAAASISDARLPNLAFELIATMAKLRAP